MEDLSAFKANDIRGEYHKNIDEKLVYKIGRALITFLNCKEIIVGRDMRVSSPSLTKFLIKGIIDSGCHVIEIGLIDSPALYFATGFYNKPGVMITASHNPAEYNGMKIIKPGAIPISELNGLIKIKGIVQSEKFFDSKKKGKISRLNIIGLYRKHILSFIDINKIEKIKVVIDGGNGMSGKMVPAIYKNLPLKIITLYFKLDGNFPNHVPNPIKRENVYDLQKKVIKEKAELGISFDGDMDRVVFVDEKGRFIDTSLISALLSKHFLEKKKKQRIVYTLVSSKIVPETIRKYGGIPICEKVGHAFIKNRMLKSNSIFGAEHSGHYYFKRNYDADSALITALIVLEIYSKAKTEGKKFSDLIQEFKVYSQIEEKSFKVKDKERMIKKIENFYKNKNPIAINRLDGITITFKDYWLNVRQSKTEPLLRINLEAKDKVIMKEKTKEIIKLIKGN